MNRFGKALSVGICSAALIATAVIPAAVADSDSVTRVSGVNRYATAAAVQAELLPDADVVFLATGRDFPDALSAGPAAAKVNGAILLTDGDKLPASTVAAIRRMRPRAIYALGGNAAVSEAAFREAQSLAPNAIAQRLSGADRYQTSLAISKKFFGNNPSKRYVASGQKYPDALAGGALAGREKAPLILVPNNPYSPNVSYGRNALTIVLGGRSAISDAMYQALGASKRYAGNNRFETAKNILDEAYPNATKVIYVVGLNFPDALCAGPAAARFGVALFLSGRDSTPVTVTLQGWVVGGTQSISDGAWSRRTPKWERPAPQPTRSRQARPRPTVTESAEPRPNKTRRPQPEPTQTSEPKPSRTKEPKRYAVEPGEGDGWAKPFLNIFWNSVPEKINCRDGGVASTELHWTRGRRTALVIRQCSWDKSGVVDAGIDCKLEDDQLVVTFEPGICEYAKKYQHSAIVVVENPIPGRTIGNTWSSSTAYVSDPE